LSFDGIADAKPSSSEMRKTLPDFSGALLS
jgi:hypothetical protein